MIRYGIISELDAAKGVARVKFEEDDIVSDWLRISVPNASGNKDESWYDVNEPVWCMMDENAETGIIAGSYYHEGNTPPVGDKDVRSTTFPDGTKVSYNRSTSELKVECVGPVTIVCTDARVEASGTVTVDTPDSTFTGNVQIDGDLSFGGNATGQGSLHVIGEIESDTQVKVGLINLTTHKHLGVQPGAGTSATPTP